MTDCTCVLKGEKRAQDPLGLDVQIVELPQVGVGNQIQEKVTYPQRLSPKPSILSLTLSVKETPNPQINSPTPHG